MNKNVQPRIVEPILYDDTVPGPEWKRGSGVRKGSLVKYHNQDRFVYDLRFVYVHTPGLPCWPDDLTNGPDATFPENVCPKLPFKRAVTYVKIAEGWVPFSEVELVNL